MKTTPDNPTDTFGTLPTKPSPEPSKKAEVWKPAETKGIFQNQDGQLKTDLPLPKTAFDADEGPCFPFGFDWGMGEGA